MASSPSDDALYGSDKDGNNYDMSSPTSGAATPGVESPVGETPEEREARMSELRDELEKVEGEINMLRQVLGSKVRHAGELKRQMGITPFQEFKQDFQSGLQHIKSSDGYQKTNDTIHTTYEKISNTQAYQKTSGAMKTAGEKTTSVFSAVGQVMSKKMGDIKNSNTFKSFDEKVSTTYASVKAKVTGSRSSSEIDEAFREAQVSEEGVVSIPSHEDDSVSSLPDGEKVPL